MTPVGGKGIALARAFDVMGWQTQQARRAILVGIALVWALGFPGTWGWYGPLARVLHEVPPAWQSICTAGSPRFIPASPDPEADDAHDPNDTSLAFMHCWWCCLSDASWPEPDFGGFYVETAEGRKRFERKPVLWWLDDAWMVPFSHGPPTGLLRYW